MHTQSTNRQNQDSRSIEKTSFGSQTRRRRDEKTNDSDSEKEAKRQKCKSAKVQGSESR